VRPGKSYFRLFLAAFWAILVLLASTSDCTLFQRQRKKIEILGFCIYWGPRQLFKGLLGSSLKARQLFKAGFKIRLMGLPEFDGARRALKGPSILLMELKETFKGPRRSSRGSINTFDGILLAC